MANPQHTIKANSVEELDKKYNEFVADKGKTWAQLQVVTIAGQLIFVESIWYEPKK